MADPRSHLAFIGTRTGGSEGIFSYRVDTTTGALTRIVHTGDCVNPSFLAFDPSHRYLYAVNQVTDGTLTAFALDAETGDLSRLDRQPTRGARPCHVSVDATGRLAFVAHHTGGLVSVLPVHRDGSLGAVVQVIEREGSGVDPERQTRSRPHAVVPGPDNRFCYVPDLGADRVSIYELDTTERRLRTAEPLDVPVRAGAGPRHIEFHPNGRVAFLLNELDSTLTSFERHPRTGALTELETVSTLPPAFDGDNQAADVHVHPSGRWVYGSNRGHDSIARFGFDEESQRLYAAGHQATFGEWPRNFALSPAGEFLFAENQHADEVVSFRVDTASGELTDTGYRESVPRPVCMRILP